jgi:hypothetical protein
MRRPSVVHHHSLIPRTLHLRPFLLALLWQHVLAVGDLQQRPHALSLTRTLRVLFLVATIHETTILSPLAFAGVMLMRTIIDQ